MKPKPVINRYSADEDLDTAFEYYLYESGPDIAISFIDEFERATDHLSRFPLSGSPQLANSLSIEGLRHWQMRRFPYLVIYVDTETCVEIWRVLHERKDIPASFRTESRDPEEKDRFRDE